MHVLLQGLGQEGEVPDPLKQRGTFGVHGDVKASEVIDSDEGRRYDSDV